jgi:glycolate oxidase iron-sulfur subunit
MQTRIATEFRDDPAVQAVEGILRNCVHCGFCLATCPTYQLLGDELDSPRGRIYLIKQLLEGQPVTDRTRLHLDRCLTCRACETTCPSGVTYGRLLDLGRDLVETRAPRPLPQRLLRRLLRFSLADRTRFALLARLGRLFRPLVPATLRAGLPAHAPAAAAPAPDVTAARRTVLLLQGCVQPTLRPTIDAAAATLLGRLGIATRVVPQAGCCGAIDHHLAAPDAALARMRRNVDAWVPALETGADAIVVTASGCGAMVKEYGHLLRDDPAYAERAARVAAAAVDPAELFRSLDLTPLGRPGNGRRIAFHAPCTLQHGQQLPGVTEALLTALGFELTPVADAHLCCGSAGTYSVLQPELARQLRSNKVAHLEAGEPELIATANIGCLHHLEAGTGTRVVHWLELVTEALDS